MWSSIILALCSFGLAMVALFYGTKEIRGRGAVLIVVLSIVVLAASIYKAVEEQVSLTQAREEVKRQQARLLTVVTAPELFIMSEFPESSIRERIQGDIELLGIVDRMVAEARDTERNPNDCSGVVVARGDRAFDFMNKVLAGEGGLSRLNYLLVLGFYRQKKDLSGLDKNTFNPFDLSMSANMDGPSVELMYSQNSALFRLTIEDEADGFKSDVASITSMEDLPGTIAVLKAENPGSAYERGYVSRFFIGDKAKGTEFGVKWTDLSPADPESGWPRHTYLGQVGQSARVC